MRKHLVACCLVGFSVFPACQNSAAAEFHPWVAPIDSAHDVSFVLTTAFDSKWSREPDWQVPAGRPWQAYLIHVDWDGSILSVDRRTSYFAQRWLNNFGRDGPDDRCEESWEEANDREFQCLQWIVKYRRIWDYPEIERTTIQNLHLLRKQLLVDFLFDVPLLDTQFPRLETAFSLGDGSQRMTGGDSFLALLEPQTASVPHCPERVFDTTAGVENRDDSSTNEAHETDAFSLTGSGIFLADVALKALDSVAWVERSLFNTSLLVEENQCVPRSVIGLSEPGLHWGIVERGRSETVAEDERMFPSATPISAHATIRSARQIWRPDVAGDDTRVIVERIGSRHAVVTLVQTCPPRKLRPDIVVRVRQTESASEGRLLATFLGNGAICGFSDARESVTEQIVEIEEIAALQVELTVAGKTKFSPVFTPE